jgi:hypothetical protein
LKFKLIVVVSIIFKKVLGSWAFALSLLSVGLDPTILHWEQVGLLISA